MYCNSHNCFSLIGLVGGWLGSFVGFIDESMPGEDSSPFSDDYYIFGALVVESDSLLVLPNLHLEIIDHLYKKYGMFRKKYKDFDARRSIELKGYDIFKSFTQRGLDAPKEFSELVDFISSEIKKGGGRFIAMAFHLSSYVQSVSGIEKNIINTFMDFGEKNSYAGVLKLPSVAKKFSKAFFSNSFIWKIVRAQAMSDLLNRLDNEVDSDLFLLLDQDANTLAESLNNSLGIAFQIDGVAAKKSPRMLKHIKHAFLVDSKLVPGIQIVDILVYAVRGLLKYRNMSLKNFGEILARSKNGKVWGYGLKVIPGKEDEWRKILAPQGVNI